MIKFTKYTGNPIIKPNPFNLWESKYVFNPGVVYDGELFHMIYRAQGADMVSRFGYAYSKDGVNFNRMTNPVFEPETDDEIYGVEDSRITFIDNSYHVCYTAFAQEHISTGLATTKNFLSWKRKGIILKGLQKVSGNLSAINKNSVLMPEKFNGKYILLHSIESDIYASISDDKIKWEKPVKILSPRKDMWDNHSVSIGGTPVKTKSGWLISYNGETKAVRNINSTGLALLGLDDLQKVIKRTDKPILYPEASWEKSGGIPNSIYTTSMIEVNDNFYVYYGGADTAIGLATITKNKIIKWIEK